MENVKKQPENPERLGPTPETALINAVDHRQSRAALEAANRLLEQRMRERAAKIGAGLQVTSEIGTGTTIKVQVYN